MYYTYQPLIAHTNKMLNRYSSRPGVKRQNRVWRDNSKTLSVDKTEANKSNRYEVVFLQFERGRAFAACANGIGSAIQSIDGGKFIRGSIVASGLTRPEANEMVESLSKKVNDGIDQKNSSD